MLLDGYSPVDVLGITVYTDSHPLCPVSVPSGTLSTLSSARNPHSHKMLLGVVVGNISRGQVSIIQPHGAMGAKTRMTLCADGYISKYGFSGFGGLEVACWPLVPKFVGFFRAKKKSSACLPSEGK